METVTQISRKTPGRSVKTDEACARLRAMAHRLGPGAKMPTVQELRQEIGVSLGTLNSALRDSEEKNILTRRHSVGIYVSPTLRKNVPLICNPEFFRNANHSPFWDILLDRVLHHGTQGMDVVCQFAVTSRGNTLLPPGLMEEIVQGRIDGILGIGLHDDTAHWIMDQGIPLVQMFGPGHVIILFDKDQMTVQAVRALAAQGCRRIALWAPTHTNVQTLFERTLNDLSLRFDPELVWDRAEVPTQSLSSDALSLPEQGYQIALKTFSGDSSPQPDGLFIADDTLARGALIAMRKLGIVAGKDVRIVTHANKESPTLLGHEGQLTLAEFDLNAFVSTLFDQMINLLAAPVLPPENVILISPQLRPS